MLLQYRFRLANIAIACALVACSSNAAAAAEVRAISVEKLQQALALSKLAAKNNLPELSLRAVRESLAGGPPVAPLQFQVGQAGVPARLQSDEELSYQQYVNEVEIALRELSGEWERQQFNPQQVFRTLAGVVLPEGRPTEVFLYPRSESASRVRSASPGASPTSNIGLLLVEWTVRAKAGDELKQLIQRRAESPRAKFEAQLLLVALAVAQDDPASAAKELADLQRTVKTATSRTQNEAAGQVATQALRNPELRAAAVDVLEAAALNLHTSGSTQNSLEPVASWLKASAVARLQLGQTDSARLTFQSFLSVHDAFYSRYPPDYAARMRQQQIQSIVGELLRQNQLVEAFRLLGDQADFTMLEQQSNRNTPVPFAASLARHLQTLSAQERYEFLLKWTLPAPSGGSVRTIAGFIPTDRPPQEFVGLLPETLRPHGFELLETTPLSSLFHSGVALLDAAAECGKLGELKGKLQALADAKAQNADVLLRLAAIIGPDAPKLREELEARAAWLEDVNLATPKSGAQLTTVPLDDFVTALYAVRHPELRDVGERMLQGCLAHSKRLQKAETRVHIAKAYAEALQRRLSGLPNDDVAPPRYRYWTPITFELSSSNSRGTPPNWWVAENGVARTVTTGTLGALVFRYPLVGEFEFSATVSEGNWSEGALLYGGLSWETFRHNNQVQMAAIQRVGVRQGPSAVMRDVAADNRSTLRVRNGQIDHFVNGHKVFTERCGAASPWFGLRANSGYTPVFRSITLTGRPQIPREVALLEDERMLGWSGHAYLENLPTAIAMPSSRAGSAGVIDDWSFSEGVLTGRRRTKVEQSSSEAPVVESLLTYERPLWDGEQLRYEFFYEPNKSGVHPALDRLAFVIQPDAVRLHWLTEGTGDWTGLARDNLADDPAGQRSGGTVPLKPNDWNEMVVALDQGTVMLRLNDTVIYTRALSVDSMRRFGLYHHREQEEARVRNAVLTGDWPKELPADLARTLMATVPPPSPAERQTAQRLIDEDHLSREASFVVRQARAMPAADRWDYLQAWVLPDVGAVRVRTRGDFVAAYDPLAAGSPIPIVSPALLLVETARELGRLEALRQQVAAIEVADGSYNLRARLSLLTIVDLLLGNPDLAAAEFLELSRLLPAVNTTVEWERWPELLASSMAMLVPGMRERAILVLDHFVDQQIHKSKSSGWRFDHRVRMLRGTARQLAMAGGSFDALRQPLVSRDWVPVTHGKADTVAIGLPEAVWVKLPAGFRHQVGHEDDFLYFRTPLRGDFEVECELSGTGHRETQIMYAGHRLALNYRLNETNYGEFTTSLPNRKLSQPVKTPLGWIPYKLTVKDGRMVVQIHGQQVYDEALPANADPWLAFYSAHHWMADVRHVKITGSPQIPDQLDLTAGPNLHGWIATYYRESARDGSTNPNWSQSGDEIVGARRPELSGTGRESLLQYHRPLVEDGEVSYRFHYAPGALHVHPALGRTVFLLDPDGVKLHDLTGGVWETSDLEIANVRIAENRARHAGPLPLRVDAENELKLSLRGDIVTLALNGVTVYDAPRAPDNNRIFGLFHWAGETEVRVRGVAYRGDWPKKLPAVKDQEIAEVDPSYQTVDANRLTQRLTHDFTQQGLGQNLFMPRGGGELSQIAQTSPEGVTVTCVGTDAWREAALTVRRIAMGDFDIQASYDNLTVPLLQVGSAGMALSVLTNSPLGSGYRMGRRDKIGGETIIDSQLGFDGLDGKRAYVTREAPAVATSGDVRAVRRGPVIHFFFRDGSNDPWRYFDTLLLGRDDYAVNTIVLQTNAYQAAGQPVSVRWKSLAIYAEGLQPK